MQFLQDALTRFTWKRMTWKAMVLVAICMLYLSLNDPTNAAGAGPMAYGVDAMMRVGRVDKPSNVQNYPKIWAGRGEYESFQVVVRAQHGRLSNVKFYVSSLKGPKGAEISKSYVTLYREHYINVSISSPHKGFAVKRLPAGCYPDALIPFIDPATQKAPQHAALHAIPFDLAEGHNQPIWVDVLVPRQAKSGWYRGEYLVTSDQGTTRGKFALRVWNFTLPKKTYFKTAFQFWPEVNQYADEELLRHKITPMTTAPSMERQMIEQWGIRTNNLGLWSKANNASTQMSPEPSVAELTKLVAQHQRGILLYNYTADEIDNKTYMYNTLKAWARNLHKVGAKNLVTMQPVPELMNDGSGSGRSAVDIWVLLPSMYEQSKANVAKVLHKGDEVWSYNCLVQDDYSPKWLLDYEPINFRIQPGFISQSLGLTGMLYWSVNSWGSDPWKNIGMMHNNQCYNGDGVLVYPGDRVGIKGVAPSMRLKWLRDGIEDYEYIRLLKLNHYPTWALKLSRKIGKDWHHWTRDPRALEAVRRQLGDKLEKIYQKKEK